MRHGPLPQGEARHRKTQGAFSGATAQTQISDYAVESLHG